MTAFVFNRRQDGLFNLVAVRHGNKQHIYFAGITPTPWTIDDLEGLKRAEVSVKTVELQTAA